MDELVVSISVAILVVLTNPYSVALRLYSCYLDGLLHILADLNARETLMRFSLYVMTA
jgi:hypothetical protein